MRKQKRTPPCRHMPRCLRYWLENLSALMPLGRKSKFSVRSLRPYICSWKVRFYEPDFGITPTRFASYELVALGFIAFLVHIFWRCGEFGALLLWDNFTRKPNLCIHKIKHKRNSNSAQSDWRESAMFYTSSKWGPLQGRNFPVGNDWRSTTCQTPWQTALCIGETWRKLSRGIVARRGLRFWDADWRQWGKKLAAICNSNTLIWGFEFRNWIRLRRRTAFCWKLNWCMLKSTKI